MHMKKLMLTVMGLAAVAGGSARAAGVAVDLHSARAVGMAGAVSAFIDDASAIYFNPAGIAQGQGLEFMIGDTPVYASRFSSCRFNSLSATSLPRSNFLIHRSPI